MLIFARKPRVHAERVLLEALGMCCTEESVLGEKKGWSMWVCHSKTRASVITALYVDMKVSLSRP